MTDFVISSGQQSGGLTIGPLDTLFVDGGGTSFNMTISGGTATIEGFDEEATIEAGGTEFVYAATVESATVSSGGLLVLSNSANGRGTLVVSGGIEDVNANATESGSVVSDGGFEYVHSGGETDDGTVAAGGLIVLSNDANGRGTLVLSGGTLVVASGGNASGTVISSGGIEIVLSGGIDSGATVAASGFEIFLSGGETNVDSAFVVSATTAFFDTATSGLVEYVFGGATVSETLVSSGGYEEIANGGSGADVTISSGGAAYNFGSETGLRIAGGGYEEVGSGGVDDQTVVSGVEVVASGGTVVSGLIDLGGQLTVQAGGTVLDENIGRGGTLLVLAGGTASDTVVSGNSLEIVSGTLSGATIMAAGVVSLGAGATVLGTVSDGGQITATGSTTFADNLKGNGSLVFNGGMETIDQGTKIGVATWSISGGSQVNLLGAMSYNGNFTLGGVSTITLGGNLTLTGTTNLYGVVNGAGRLVLGGGVATIFAGARFTMTAWTLSEGDAVTLQENLSYAGSFLQGRAATLSILTHDTLTLTGSTDLFGKISGGGSLSLTGGPVTLYGGADFTMSAWSVTGATAVTLRKSLGYAGSFTDGVNTSFTLLSGATLALSGQSSLAGVVRGAGTLAFTGGTTAIGAGTKFTMANWSLSTGAKATLNESLTYTSGFVDATGTSLGIGTGKTLSLSGPVTGGGTIKIGSGSVLDMTGTVASTQRIAFGATSGKLVFTDDSDFKAVISGFTGSDRIDAASFTFAKTETVKFVENAAKTAGTLILTEGAQTLKLTLFGQYMASEFKIASDGKNGTLITYTPTSSGATIQVAAPTH